jgi:NUMOD3 motif
MNHSIYIHKKSGTNEIFYVGQFNVLSNPKRPFTVSKRSLLWKKVVRKYGYSIHIISEKLSKESANKLEMFLISEIGRLDLNKGKLVNLTDGGEGTVGCKMSEETKKQISDKLKGIKRTPEEIKKSVDKRIGQKRSEESKEKMRTGAVENTSHLGHKHSIETKRKIGLRSKGRKRSEESLKSASEKMKGNKNSLGYKHSETAKQNMSKNNSKYWTGRKRNIPRNPLTGHYMKTA